MENIEIIIFCCITVKKISVQLNPFSVEKGELLCINCYKISPEIDKLSCRKQETEYFIYFWENFIFSMEFFKHFIIRK